MWSSLTSYDDDRRGDSAVSTSTLPMNGSPRMVNASRNGRPVPSVIRAHVLATFHETVLYAGSGGFRTVGSFTARSGVLGGELNEILSARCDPKQGNVKCQLVI